MTQQNVKNIILSHLKDYQPVSVGIFGSFARGESTGKSDIDILVKFKVAPSLLTLIKLENELSDLLGIKVDLITTGAIKNKRVRKSIKKDLISIL
ncbi:MAG TPA: nucleotidyltransferase family protein [Bacteroidales bacterium]|jgi:predicted nucleotidyltransferase|nr:nucleotidyltransferase family protein [Bacteroidales bacterium]MBP7038043.1 nucleotidyltransferase family protein [Bacteroidales bacterium]MZP64782.1 nucleotidyltransferase [Bacteroidales bacterium]NLK54987.1 nucleotidyltransferase family protein [Bacteroidales bacterium]HOG57256.1 nucleotidyltransferase family protein [Bacteroidales bacterium]